MAVVRRGKLDKDCTTNRMKYYAVVLEGYGENQEYSIVIGADYFDIQEEGSLAMFHACDPEADYDSGARLVAALRGWKRVMEITKIKFDEIVKDTAAKDKESSKKLNSVFTEPGRM